MKFDDFGPAEKLYAAIRRRAPQVAASIVPDADTGLSHVRVTYRFAGPQTIGWDGATYRHRHGDGPWSSLPADPEEAADAMAEVLGARTPTDEAPSATDAHP